MVTSFCSMHLAPVVLFLVQTWWLDMNQEMNGLLLRLTEHICDSVTVDQYMVATVMTSKYPLGTRGSVASLLAATSYLSFQMYHLKYS